MELALRAMLEADTALPVKERINWGTHPQGTPLPALVLNVISDSDESTHMQGTGELWRARVQIDCYGADYGAALGLVNAVIDLLHGHRGGMFRLIQLDNRRDHHETGAADRPYRIGLDFIINYRRTGHAG